MNERVAGRLELTWARARALFGRDAGGDGSKESSDGASGEPNDTDAVLIAARIRAESELDDAAALSAAAALVAKARSAVARLGDEKPVFTDMEVCALEAVLQVRGRPAVRVLENRLEALANHPGAELWEIFISDFEDHIIRAASATGAAIASVPATGNPPWMQGSAWLIAEDIVVTNRHVLRSDSISLIEPDGAGAAMRLKAGNRLSIEFAHDSRSPATRVRHAVKSVLYVAPVNDPVDLALLMIEPVTGRSALSLCPAGAALPANLFVVGHPAPMHGVPAAVEAVFGRPDGRKRVSFGKLLDGAAPAQGQFVHDASTIGGYSGGPVVDIAEGTVAGLHYFGDPTNGNLAFAADTLRAHEAHRHWPK